MKNKRIMLSEIILLAVTGLTLVSCKESTGVIHSPLVQHQETTGLLSDYGEKGVERLADKLRHSRTALTHILVIGDSHTAADFLSGELRTQFQHRFGNGGIGFISPLAVPGNRYSHVRFSKAKGWQLETSRREKNPDFTLGGNIATPLVGSRDYRITATDGESYLQAQVLYRSQGDATLRLEHNALPLTDTRQRWAFSPSVRVPASFSVSLPQGNNAVQLAGFWLTATRPHGVIVSALGINGAQISMLDKWQSGWTDTLRVLKPDLVILAYGTNEAFNTDLPLEEYRQTLVRQIKNIRQAQPHTAILLVGPGSSIINKHAARCEQRQSPLLLPVINVQKQVAKSQHTLFWDWFAWMGGDCSVEEFAKQGKARPDLIHLTQQGYQATAAALWQDLTRKLNLR